MPRHRSSAMPLAWLYAGLIVYASLYPFSEWQLPRVGLFDFLSLQWPQWWTGFDLVSNLLGYLPLGALVFGARVRSGGRTRGAIFQAALAGTALSFGLETLQNFLPSRVPSNLDLCLNVVGCALGAALGTWLRSFDRLGWWQRARDLWFIEERSAGALTLTLLWPLGLLFPLPAPLGMGQVLVHLQEFAHEVAQGTLLAPWFEAWSAASPEPSVLPPLSEFSLIALGLLTPCLVAFSVAKPGWRRLVLVAGAFLLGVLITTLSTALNFGPQHAWAWSTPQALGAMAAAAALAACLLRVPARIAAALGLMALTALVTLVAQAPADPYFAQSLQAWEQGRFIRFHGAARWVGWLWPYAAIVYLLARMSGHGEE